MALVKCKECGGILSTEAKACPHCGALQSRRASYLWLLVLPVGAIAAFLTFGFLSSDAVKSRDRAAIDQCWRSARTVITGSAARSLADKACRAMVADFERKYGPSPSLPRN
jgi:hypothetical protein